MAIVPCVPKAEYMLSSRVFPVVVTPLCSHVVDDQTALTGLQSLVLENKENN